MDGDKQIKKYRKKKAYLESTQEAKCFACVFIVVFTYIVYDFARCSNRENSRDNEPVSQLPRQWGQYTLRYVGQWRQKPILKSHIQQSM